uniref:Serine/threonine-protein kinase cx32 n=1 Tax=Rhizophora mucronata TaxID=61149 RepID=A0A2P2JQZ0_RHIMU
MGNCLRSGSPTASNDHHHCSIPTFAYGSSTVYSAAESRFSETVSDGNSDSNTVYTSAKSHSSETVAKGNEGRNPFVQNARAAVGLNEALSNLKAFTFGQLKTATGNFKKQNLLGEGGFGKVFNGWIDERTFAPSKPGSGMVVAVKKMKLQSLDQLGEWESEVSFFGSLSHPNLIKLLGFCSENVKKTRELLLVYEFTPNGSLADHLFTSLFMKNPATEPLSWNLRLKIAIGAARGMAFLHMSQVIHKAFIPSNILLDGNYNAKISGFGLAREGPTEGHSPGTTRVIGTNGYAAPEYIATGNNFCANFAICYIVSPSIW